MTDLQPEELIAVMELESEELDDLGAAPLSDEPAVAKEPGHDAPEQQDGDAPAQQDGDARSGEVTDESEDAATDPPKRRRPGKAARKITRLESELQATRDRLAQLEGQQHAAPAASEDPEPREDDFNDLDDFLVAKAEHRVLKRLRAEQAESQRQAFARTQASRQAELQAAHAQRIEEARDNHDDYDDVVNAAADIQVTEAMGQAIMESEQGAELVYHLATHPDEARRIAALSVTGQARELGKIEARLAPAARPRKKPTAAPNPPGRVKPSGSAPRSLENLDHDAYRRARLGG